MKGTFLQIITWLYKQDKDKIFEIKETRPKRSLNANSYFYLLQNKLADVLKTGNDELHIELLKRYSEVLIVPLFPTQNPSGFFKYFEKYKEGKNKGKDIIIYKVYKPSAEMDSKEFTRLLDGIISECKQVGIETMTPNQLKELEGYEK